MNLKVVSLNIWNGGRLFADMLEFLAAENADIYFLQEVYAGQGSDLADRFRTYELLYKQFRDYDSFFAPTFGDIRVAEGMVEQGNVLLSRWPLTNRTNFFGSVPYGQFDHDQTTDFSHFPSPTQIATIEIDNRQITLINVHGPVNLDGLADTERRLELRDYILQQTTSTTIVSGDFNVRPQTQTIKGLEQKLKPVFPPERGTSFNLSRKDLDKFPGYATAVVDMMFVTPNIQVIQQEMPEVDVSDHLPLVAELAI